jgi:GT2 family glycosyltransferase
MSEPLVSIVVPTLHRPEALRRCLDSIERCVDPPHETLVVQVADDVATKSIVKPPGARVIVQPTRDGFVKAANLGFRQARGHYIVQINDDCELLPHTIANAVRFLEAPAHERIGQAAFFHNSPMKRNIFAQVQLDDEWFFVNHVRGLCYANFGMARRELYERLGYFDERYFMYGADPDFSLKIWHEAKLSVVPCPGALVRHDQLDDERAKKERGCQDSDNRMLFAKWGL